MAELSSDGFVEAIIAILASDSIFGAPFGVLRGDMPPVPDVETFDAIYHVGNPNRGLLVVTHLGTAPQLGRTVEWRSERRNDHLGRIDGAWDLEPGAVSAKRFRMITDRITLLLNARETVQMALGVAGAGLQMGAWTFTADVGSPVGEDHLWKGYWQGTLGNAATDNARP